MCRRKDSAQWEEETANLQWITSRHLEDPCIEQEIVSRPLKKVVVNRDLIFLEGQLLLQVTMETDPEDTSEMTTIWEAQLAKIKDFGIDLTSTTTDLDFKEAAWTTTTTKEEMTTPINNRTTTTPEKEETFKDLLDSLTIKEALLTDSGEGLDLWEEATEVAWMELSLTHREDQAIKDQAMADLTMGIISETMVKPIQPRLHPIRSSLSKMEKVRIQQEELELTTAVRLIPCLIEWVKDYLMHLLEMFPLPSND